MACFIEKKNLGLSKCKDIPALPKMIITTPLDFKFVAADLVDDVTFEAAIQDAIVAGKANRIYLWPPFVGFENASEETQYEDTPLADIKVRPGKYRYRAYFNEALCTHKAMVTHSGKNQRAFLIDIENKAFGLSNAAGDFYGFTLSLLNVEKMILSDGAVATKTPLYFVLADSEEIDKYGSVIDVPFINNIERLTDVEITIVSALSSALIVDVATECDGTAISGLLQADFIVTTTLGASQSIDTVVESTTIPGRYTITPTTSFADGFITLRAAALLTVQAYESNTVAINVP